MASGSATSAGRPQISTKSNSEWIRYGICAGEPICHMKRLCMNHSRHLLNILATYKDQPPEG
jgi:hypothetical protein